jgi:transcription elongation factor GreA
MMTGRYDVFPTTAPTARWFVFHHAPFLPHGTNVMQIVSAQEKAALEAKREELYKQKIDVQERIRRAASLGDLSENAEYHYAKEENRKIERELAELEMKIRNLAVVSTENVPEDLVYLGHTVKLLDLDDDSEQLVRLVGEAQPPTGAEDVMPVSVNSPMGEALMKARVGETVKVKAPRGTMEFKILEIVQ